MLRLTVILLTLFYCSSLFSKDVRDEVNEKTFCGTNSNYFLKNLGNNIYPNQITIKTEKLKSWYINLIKGFYSTPRSEWKIDHNYKKYESAKISIDYGNDVVCDFKGKVKIHGGRKDHIDIKNLKSSLRVKIFDGHLNHSRHFALMIPSTRLGDNEIFITQLVHELGIISPDTFYTNVKVNNNKEIKMIFQDMDYEEILRRNNRIEGVIITENKTKNNNYNLTRILNTEKQILGTGWENNRNYFLNALDKTNYLLLNEKFYNQNNILSNNKNYFVDRNKFTDFYLLISATNGFHGYQFGDRRYYYNVILDLIEPIYYDWKSNILDKNYEFNKSISNFKTNEQDILKLINKIKKINLYQFKKVLNDKGINISERKLDKTINNIINYLGSQNIVNYEKEKEFTNFDYTEDLLFHVDKNNYEICDKEYECDKAVINQKIERELFKEHEIQFEDKIIKFVRRDKISFKSNLLPKPKSINAMNKIDLDDGIKLYFNDNVKVSKKNKHLFLEYQNYNGRVFFIDGVIKNTIINVETSKISNSQNNLENENFIPYCLTFYNTKLVNIIIEANDLNCNKAIRFSNSSGNIKKLIVNNSLGDAVSAEISNLEIADTKITSAGDDCLDFESGNYTFQSLNLRECSDKAFQIKRKSNVKIMNVSVHDSKYGISVLDSSYVKVEKSNINTKKDCLVVYRENDGYIGSSAEVNKKFLCKNNQYFKDDSSIIMNK